MNTTTYSVSFLSVHDRGHSNVCFRNADLVDSARHTPPTKKRKAFCADSAYGLTLGVEKCSNGFKARRPWPYCDTALRHSCREKHSKHLVRLQTMGTRTFIFMLRIGYVQNTYLVQNCIMRSCMVCTHHSVLLGWSNQGGWDGRDI
jgi:hypothetical protein